MMISGKKKFVLNYLDERTKKFVDLKLQETEEKIDERWSTYTSTFEQEQIELRFDAFDYLERFIISENGQHLLHLNRKDYANKELRSPYSDFMIDLYCNFNNIDKLVAEMKIEQKLWHKAFPPGNISRPTK